MVLNEDNSKKSFGISGNAAYSHAYIVWGGSEDDRSRFVKNLAMAMICEGRGEKPCGHCVHCEKAARGIHPDIILYEHDEKSRTIYVDQIRALRDDAVIMPNDAAKKVYIICHAGSMNTPAQNALLKVLEEPPGGASFILSTESTETLLSTVRSRCVAVSVENSKPADQNQPSGIAVDFLDALADPMRMAEITFKLDKLDKNAFADFIEDAKTAIAKKLQDGFREERAFDASYLIKTVAVLDRAKEYLGVNVGLVHITGMIGAALSS